MDRETAMKYAGGITLLALVIWLIVWFFKKD